MDQPASAGADDIREARAALIESLTPMTSGEVADNTFRAQSEGFREIAGVSADSETETYFRLRTHLTGPRWAGVPVVMEPGGGEVTRRYYCEGRGACGPNDVKFPESYFIDREGRIVAFVVGPMDWSQPAARSYLEALIKG